MKQTRRVSSAALIAAVVATTLHVAAANATEGGTSMYLLGDGGAGAAVMPPLEGVFFDNSVYIYSGDADAGKSFDIGGKVVLGMDATVVADFPTLLWVPSTDFAGGTLALGATLPIGNVDIGVNAVLSGPGGSVVAASQKDSTFTMGDPVLSGMLGWNADKWHIQVGTMVNVPIGNYRKGEVANLALHRWVVDGSFALTWNNPDSGWDISGKAGVALNGNNAYTHYSSGDEFHFQASIEKAFSPTFSLGLLAFHMSQISGDSGTGANLGSFKGELSGVGLTAATTVMLGGKVPVALRINANKEFDVKNRLKGGSVFLSLTMPLSVKLPSGAGG